MVFFLWRLSGCSCGGGIVDAFLLRSKHEFRTEPLCEQRWSGGEGAEVGDVGEVGHETVGVDEVQEEFDVSSWIGSDEEASLSKDEFVDVGVDVDEQLEQQNCEGCLTIGVIIRQKPRV
ncbi:uncharacterized protein HKW66_Vig0167920 [Vigna angularis]|uniref:Uncharacterized protein n=1 Tax=Phaseolus angularis TaxID=3914 RepID=A0A8T0JQE8_PHAAN|nr:uncharacterized protein HKW66_Vig0167920 [Vigna angularis]